MFKANVGTSTQAAAQAAGKEAAQKAAEGLDAIKLAYVYCSCDYDSKEVIAGVKEALPGVPCLGNLSLIHI